MDKPTKAQIEALRLAARDADGIRYYFGGFYTIPAETGDNGQHAIPPRGGCAYSNVPAIRACLSRGWLAESPGDIYARRWTLTDAGRAILDAHALP